MIWRCEYCRKIVFGKKIYFKDDLICKSCLEIVPDLSVKVYAYLKFYLIDKKKKDTEGS